MDNISERDVAPLFDEFVRISKDLGLEQTYDNFMVYLVDNGYVVEEDDDE